jgi:hypothetical protein
MLACCFEHRKSARYILILTSSMFRGACGSEHMWMWSCGVGHVAESILRSGDASHPTRVGLGNREEKLPMGMPAGLSISGAAFRGAVPLKGADRDWPSRSEAGLPGTRLPTDPTGPPQPPRGEGRGEVESSPGEGPGAQHPPDTRGSESPKPDGRGPLPPTRTNPRGEKSGDPPRPRGGGTNPRQGTEGDPSRPRDGGPNPQWEGDLPFLTYSQRNTAHEGKVFCLTRRCRARAGHPTL